MSLFTVNNAECSRCGACEADCPAKVITADPETGFPVQALGAEERCIHCGHCVAICPRGALSHAAMAPEACPPVRKEWLLSPEQSEHYLRSRRSIRVFKNGPVERAVIEKLVLTARYAPSGHNSQPVEWLVIHKTGELRRLTGMVIDWMRHLLRENPEMAKSWHMDLVVAGWELGFDAVCRDAPHLVICHAPKTALSAPPAATIALAYMELAAPSLGLGACWAGFFDRATQFWQPLFDALGLPEGHVALGSMMVGIPKYRYYRLPIRREPSVTWR